MQIIPGDGSEKEKGEKSIPNAQSQPQRFATKRVKGKPEYRGTFHTPLQSCPELSSLQLAYPEREGERDR